MAWKYNMKKTGVKHGKLEWWKNKEKVTSHEGMLMNKERKDIHVFTTKNGRTGKEKVSEGHQETTTHKPVKKEVIVKQLH